MNKKLKYLSALPLYGTCILLIYLYFLSLKKKISQKKFFKAFTICAITSAICWYIVMMVIYVASKSIVSFDFNSLGIFLTLIIGGYMINAFSFKYIDKKWSSLADDTKEESFLSVSKEKIILIAFVIAIIIIVIAFTAIFALGLI